MSRDEAIGGIPLTKNDQLVLFSRNRTTQSTGIRVIATIYDPVTNTTQSIPVIGPFSTTGTTFTAETAQFSALGLLPDGQILVSVIVTSDNITNPVQLWVAVELFRQNQSLAWLCEGYAHSSHVPSWRVGSSNFEQSPVADPAVDGALFTHQVQIANDAAGASDISTTVTAATGGRVEVVALSITNTDTAARATSISVLDPTNILFTAVFNSALGAANQGSYPAATFSDAATFQALGGGSPIVIAGANTLRLRVAAVALSQEASFALILRVWGSIPTFTHAGGGTPVITVNTSRFETG